MQPVATVNLFRCDAEVAKQFTQTECPLLAGNGGPRIGTVKNIRYGGNGFIIGELKTWGLSDDPAIVDLPKAE